MPEQPKSSTTDPRSSLRELVADRWYEKAAGIKIVTLKKESSWGHFLSLAPSEAAVQLAEIKTQGFQAVEIFAPAYGLHAYNGLDTVDHFQIDPELGTMDDFRQLVRIAHTLNLAVIVFINLGYFSIEAPDWLMACKDKKAGIVSNRVDWFLWSDRADTPPPPAQEDYHVAQEERKKSKDSWGWFYSDLAGSYFWSRWWTAGPDEKHIPLPQVKWGSDSWREEADRIVRHWMDTGIDGMLIDAPLCYPYQTWEHNRHIAEIVNSYGNALLQPEGGKDTAWMTECGFNCIQNYGFFFPPDTRVWSSKNELVEAINEGNSRRIEPCLRYYHDEMVQAGGVLYSRLLDRFDGNLDKRHLQMAILTGIGDIIAYAKMDGDPDPEETSLLRTKAAHPALFPVALRQTISTSAGEKCYAFLKTARDGLERVLCVYNLQSTAETVEVDVMLVDVTGLVDIRISQRYEHSDPFLPVAVDLPAYGYRFFEVLPSGEPRLRIMTAPFAQR